MGSDRLRLISAVLALAMGSASCETLTTRAYVGFMSSDVSGEQALDSSSGGAPLGDIESDVEDIFGIGDNSPSIWLKAQFITEDYGRITASAFQFDENGSGSLANDFGDISGGAPVATSFELRNLKTSWTYDVVDLSMPSPLGDFGLHLSPGICVNIIDTQTRVNSSSPVVAFEEVDTLAGVPMLYLQSGVTLGIVGLDLEGGWMEIDLQDADGVYFDFEAMGRVSIAPKVELVAGYRYLSMDSDGDADGQAFEADLQLTGWYLGGGFVF